MATGFSDSFRISYSAGSEETSIIGGSDSFRIAYSAGSDETFDFTCCPCEVKGLMVEAAFYCSICDDFCCNSCQKVHNSIKATKSHPVFGRDEVGKWGQQLPTTVCPDHTDEALTLLCFNHSTLCCSICVSLHHRTCTDMAYVPKIAKDIKQSQDIVIVGQNVDAIIQYTDKMIKSGKKNQTTLDKSKEDYVDNINNIQQQIDFLNNLKKSASNEMNKFHNSKVNDLQTLMKSLDDYKTKLSQSQMATQPSSTNNESQLFIEMFTAHQQLPTFLHELQKLGQTSQTTSFHLDRNPKLQEIFTTIKNLGELKEDKTTIQRKLPTIKPLPVLQLTQSLPSSHQASTLAAAVASTTYVPAHQTSTLAAAVASTTCVPAHQAVKPQQQHQQQLYKASNGRKLKVKMSSDIRDCVIIGSCQMPNGDILLADNYNQKVKRLNTKYKLTDYLNLPAAPIAICCMADTEAVVTGNNKSIHFLSTARSKMSVTRSLQMDYLCYGIAHHNGRRLFVSDYNENVYIYTTSGKHLKTVHTDNNGASIFSDTRHICVSPDGSKIYVADWDKGLVTLDSAGNHLSTYTSDDLKGAWGICVDRQGRVLVCGYESDNVLQLDEEGTTRVGEVVGRGDVIYYPESICIDNHNSTLIVGHGSVNDYIKEFDLK